MRSPLGRGLLSHNNHTRTLIIGSGDRQSTCNDSTGTPTNSKETTLPYKRDTEQYYNIVSIDITISFSGCIGDFVHYNSGLRTTIATGATEGIVTTKGKPIKGTATMEDIIINLEWVIGTTVDFRD